MAITAIHPYLSFNGNCEEALAHYAKVLGAKNTGIFRYGEAPAGDGNDDCPTPPDYANKVMNTAIQLGDLILMGSDNPPQYQQKAQGMSVSLQVNDEAEAERIFAGLMEGSTEVMMPIAETFWAKRFGMGVDRFGTPWMVNCSREMPA